MCPLLKKRFAAKAICYLTILSRTLLPPGVILLIAFPLLGQSNANREWRHYGGDPGGMRFSTLVQINKQNVHRLE